MEKRRTLFHKDGSYTIENINRYSYLYYPLFNYHGMKSVVSPSMHGDIKIDQNHFGMIPTSQEDLNKPLHARNMFFRVNGEVWNVTGQTPYQKKNPDNVTLHNGLIYQEVTRLSNQFQVKIRSFVPQIPKWMELHHITFKNTSNDDLNVKTVFAIPLFSRSADNLRDHRHVTSLLNRVYLLEDGIYNQPTLSFDERGHQVNDMAYGVFTKSSKHETIYKYHPVLQSFFGEGQDMFYPDAVVKDEWNQHKPGDVVAGFEAISGIEYQETVITPGEEISFILSFQMEKDPEEFFDNNQKVLGFSEFETLYEQNKQFWQEDLKTSDYILGNEDMSGWLRQVGFQPLARRIYGNSFLPHHDYGRGGRGWRDLWQDSLELILKMPSVVRGNILAYLKGVRIDGSNATIIGSKKGEFLADRNKIVRVWSDHGAWPFVTINLYIQRTGDFNILLQDISYFKDKFVFYTKSIDDDFQDDESNELKTRKNEVYKGSILEHLLLEHLSAFYNVGKNGNIRIEDADWNDGFDMASREGETVAFTNLYTGNLKKMIALLKELKKSGIDSVLLLEEMLPLLDTINHPINYANPKQKQTLLQKYFQSVKSKVSGKKIPISVNAIIEDLCHKYHFFKTHLMEKEWLETDDREYGIFNGYYNKYGERVESLTLGQEKMTLTGQVFPIMAHIASKSQIEKMIKAVNRYLYDETVGSYRLNTNFGENKMDLGRFMGFAYGHKENGAMFSHMTVMYCYALLDNGFVEEGAKVLHDLIDYLLDIDKSKVLPGIPEYIDSTGRGMYHYLTGSASWVILTVVEQLFGVRGNFGDFLIQPKLPLSYFRDGLAKINLIFHDYPVELVIENPDRLPYGSYQIKEVIVNEVTEFIHQEAYILTKEKINQPTKIRLILEEKK